MAAIAGRADTVLIVQSLGGSLRRLRARGYRCPPESSTRSSVPDHLFMPTENAPWAVVSGAGDVAIRAVGDGADSYVRVRRTLTRSPSRSSALGPT